MFTEIQYPLAQHSLAALVGPTCSPGNGPPLVLLHGVLRRGSDFVPLFPHLLTRWQVLALDQRGHGNSARVSGRYLVTDYVSDVVEWIRGTFREPVAIYGHSLGAMVALGAAAELGTDCRAVLLEDPPFETMGNQIAATPFLSQFQGLTKIVRPGRSVEELVPELARMPITIPKQGVTIPFGQLRDSVALRFMASCLQHVDRDVLAPIVAGRWLDGYDWQMLAQRLRCPALLLQADGDAGGMLTDADTRAFAELAQGSHIARLPQIGHQMHWQATESVLRIVLAFLESTR
ncbi:MAG: alpha/beta fold hydrolase [Planctomycetota bacterium]